MDAIQDLERVAYTQTQTHVPIKSLKNAKSKGPPPIKYLIFNMRSGASRMETMHAGWSVFTISLKRTLPLPILVLLWLLAPFAYTHYSIRGTPPVHYGIITHWLLMPNAVLAPAALRRLEQHKHNIVALAIPTRTRFPQPCPSVPFPSNHGLLKCPLRAPISQH